MALMCDATKRKEFDGSFLFSFALVAFFCFLAFAFFGSEDRRFLLVLYRRRDLVFFGGLHRESSFSTTTGR
jgi:hypothetical protein